MGSFQEKRQKSTIEKIIDKNIREGVYSMETFQSQATGLIGPLNVLRIPVYWFDDLVEALPAYERLQREFYSISHHNNLIFKGILIIPDTSRLKRNN